MSAFLCLLDVPDPDFSEESPNIYLQHNDCAIKAPNHLYTYSIKLKESWEDKVNIVPVEHICPKEDLQEIINAINTDNYLNHNYFLSFVKLANYLIVDESFLSRLIPLHFLNLSNGMRNCYLFYTLFNMDRYRNFCKTVCRQRLGIHLYGNQRTTYSRFKRMFRNLWWNQF